jgi:hypothetical protein
MRSAAALAPLERYSSTQRLFIPMKYVDHIDTEAFEQIFHTLPDECASEAEKKNK